jgi:hypothetical protein
MLARSPDRPMLRQLTPPRWPRTRTQAPCENILYGFQGGPTGRPRRRHGALAFAPLALPLRRRQRRAAGAKSMKPAA